MLKYDKNSTFGLLFRFFIPKGTDEKRREQMLTILERAILNSLEIIEKNVCRVRHITILIPRDESQKTIDDGQTYKYLTEHLFSNPTGDIAWFKEHIRRYRNIFSLRVVKEGAGLNTGLLNQGFWSQIKEKIDYTICLSPEYYEYLTVPNLQAITECARQGARVVQFQHERVLTNRSNGNVTNVFAAWHNQSITTVGLFGRNDIDPKVGNHKIPYRGADGLIAANKIMGSFPGPFLAYFSDQGSRQAKYRSAQSPKREAIKLAGAPEAYRLACLRENINMKKLRSRIIH